MKVSQSIVLTAIFFIACTSPSKDKEDKNSTGTIPVKTKDSITSITDYFKVVGDSATIPSFEIDVVLSEKAEKKLKDKKESVIVTAYFEGEPKDTTKYLEDGEYAVGTHSIELLDSRIAKFEGIKISKAMYESLLEKDIRILINIYSGRRSSKLNLLDCGILEKTISEAKDKKFTISGKLIGE